MRTRFLVFFLALVAVAAVLLTTFRTRGLIRIEQAKMETLKAGLRGQSLAAFDTNMLHSGATVDDSVSPHLRFEKNPGGLESKTYLIPGGVMCRVWHRDGQIVDAEIRAVEFR